jgi:hypothetical protein
MSFGYTDTVGGKIPGFQDNGNWWDPAAIFSGPVNTPLPSYTDPMRPSYNPTYDPQSMSMSPFIQNLTNGINLNTQGMDQYRKEATRTGPSTWSGLARNQLNADQASAGSELQRQSAGNAATARSQLAMRGGLSGGAAERLATNSNRDAMMGQQQLASRGLSNRAQIATTDEANRIKMLQGLPSMEVEQLRPQQWRAEQQIAGRRGDINNQINESSQMNQFNMAQYQELMRQNAASRNADAYAAAAPKDRGFFGNLMGGLF